jgi:hypothetical protein
MQPVSQVIIVLTIFVAKVVHSTIFRRFDLAAQDLLTTLTLTEIQANNLIDKLCEPTNGDDTIVVAGALNVTSGVFMPWNDYLAGPGRGQDPGYNYATNEWETFWGTCHLAAQSTWFQHGPTTLGNTAFNVRWDPALQVSRRLPVAVYVPPFRCRTTLPSWDQRVQNNHDCAQEFGRIRGLPAEVTAPQHWWGYTRRDDTYLTVDPEMVIPACEEAVCTATTTMRVVRAVQVFHVVEYSWNSARSQHNVDSWQGRERLVHWDYVYSSGGYIDGLALMLMLPDPNSYANLQCYTQSLSNINECY